MPSACLAAVQRLDRAEVGDSHGTARAGRRRRPGRCNGPTRSSSSRATAALSGGCGATLPRRAAPRPACRERRRRRLTAATGPECRAAGRSCRPRRRRRRGGVASWVAQHVARLQQHVDHRGGRRELVAAQPVEQRLHLVRQFGDVGKAEGRCATLDRVGAAEDRVERLVVGRVDVELEQEPFHARRGSRRPPRRRPGRTG